MNDWNLEKKKTVEKSASRKNNWLEIYLGIDLIEFVWIDMRGKRDNFTTNDSVFCLWWRIIALSEIKKE